MKLLRLSEVLQKIPYSRSAIYRLIAAGEFPPPSKIGPRTAVWTEDQVDEWIRTKICAGITPASASQEAAA
jgi:prophage regulatory protein